MFLDQKTYINGHMARVSVAIVRGAAVETWTRLLAVIRRQSEATRQCSMVACLAGIHSGSASIYKDVGLNVRSQ